MSIGSKSFGLVLQFSGFDSVFGGSGSNRLTVGYSYPKCKEGRKIYCIVGVGEGDKKKTVYITDKYDMERIIGLNLDLQNLGGADPDDLYQFGVILRQYDEEVGCGFVLFAADQGSIDACLDIGINQYGREDADQDALKFGKKYLQVAADKGSACAKCWLGSYYAEGKGCTQDRIQAKKWIKEAAQECTEAEKYIDQYGLQ